MYNKTILVGRLTKDPEINSAAGKTPMSGFTLAVDRGGDYGTDFIQMKSFGKVADNLVKYKKKGDLLIVEASLKSNSYEKEGKKIYTQDLIVSNITYLSNSKTLDKTQEKELADNVVEELEEEDELEM